MSFNPRILIIEDEIFIGDYLMELLQEEGFDNSKMANNKEEALLLMNTFLPEIILMDINIQGENSGIELATIKNDNARIIFITGQYDHNLMTQAFDTNPEAYLTKPIKKIDLIAAIGLVSHKQRSKCITIKDGYRKVKINLDNILFIKSENNYIDIQLEDKKFTIRQTLEHFLKEIDCENFLRIHRSYIVNTTKISAKKSSTVIIEEFEIPFSRNLNFTL